MGLPHVPDLLRNLEGELALGDDPASRAIKERIRAVAERMYPASRVVRKRRAQRITIRGVLATVPRLYAGRRQRRRLVLGTLARFLTIAYSVCGACILALLVAILLLLFFGVDEESARPSTLQMGWGSELVGVSTVEADGDDVEDVEAMKGPDEQEDPVEDKTVQEEAAEEVTENSANQEDPDPEQAGKESSEESDQVVDLPAFTDQEVETILNDVMGEIGTGKSAVPPPMSPKQIGRLIRQDPSAATLKMRKEEIGSLSKGRRSEIVVVLGEHDEVQRVMRRFRVPYRTISVRRLATADLSRARALIVNCDVSYKRRDRKSATALRRQLRKFQTEATDLRDALDDLTVGTTAHERKQKQLREMERKIGAITSAIDAQSGPAAAALNVRRFVARGGSVFSSDWALSLLEDAFPGYLSYAGTTSGSRTTISVPRKTRSHALLRHTLLDDATSRVVGGRSIRWRLESSSYLYTVDESRAQVLVRGGRQTRGHTSVAVTFRPELGETGAKNGRVLHILSHFEDQGDKYGEFVLQNMLLNFLLDALKRGR